MKTTSILVILAWFASHSKQIIASSGILAAMSSKAQFTTDYRPPSKAIYYVGNWSGVDLYSVRDSADGLAPQFRILTPLLLPAISTSTASTSSALYLNPSTKEVFLGPIAAPTITGSGGTSVLTSGNTFTVSTPAYSAGTGISISGSVISNTASSTSITSTSTLITINGSAPNYSITARRQQTYSGVTSAAGTYTVNFGTAYTTTPNIVPGIIGNYPSYTAVVTSKSTTGFTVMVYALTSILSLGLVPQYSAMPGVPVDVIVTQN